MEDHEALREKHKRCGVEEAGFYCEACYPAYDDPMRETFESWPCPVIRALDEVERLREINRQVGEKSNRYLLMNAELEARLHAAQAQRRERDERVAECAFLAGYDAADFVDPPLGMHSSWHEYRANRMSRDLAQLDKEKGDG